MLGGGGEGATCISVGGPGLKSTSALNTTLGTKERDGIYMGSYFWTNLGENSYFAGGGGGGQYTDSSNGFALAIGGLEGGGNSGHFSNNNQ